jgi:hypothetical protein
MKRTLFLQSWTTLGKILISAAAVFIALALSACGGSSSTTPAAPTPAAPVPSASVTSISQTTENATGFIIFTNHYSDGHATTCTGILESAINSYQWRGDCVPDGK